MLGGTPEPQQRGHARHRVRWAMHAPPRGRETSTKVDLELPSRKISGKRPVDDSRVAFPGAVRFPLHGVDRALLNMLGVFVK
jgi:hypothetical protein